MGKGFAFENRGELQPKGFAEPIQTFEVAWQSEG
jgi:hypothetical protein